MPTCHIIEAHPAREEHYCAPCEHLAEKGNTWAREGLTCDYVCRHPKVRPGTLSLIGPVDVRPSWCPLWEENTGA